MQWVAEVKNLSPMRFFIKEKIFTNLTTKKEFPGYYLYSYEGNNTRCTYDYLLDTLPIAKDVAMKEFSVPLDAWVQVE